MIFAYCYIILPFFMVISLIYVVFSKKFRTDIGDTSWMLLLILGLAFFTNFSRGIVRHSLAEGLGSVYRIGWTAFLFIAIFISCIKRKKELFLPVFALLMIGNSLLIKTTNYSETNLADVATEKVGEFTQTWTSEDATVPTCWEMYKANQNKVVRVYWDHNFEKPYSVVVNALLEEDETFVDYMNSTFLYSAMGKQCPVYVSQSPLQLSGEFTQEMFVEQIKDVPIVFMAVKNIDVLDGLANNYRYYLISEYIYQNYVPLLVYENNFAVWCDAQRYEELYEKAKELVHSTEYPISYADYGYDGPAFVQGTDGEQWSYLNRFHSYSLGYLPSIWMVKEEEIRLNQKCKFDSEEKLYFIENPEAISKEAGNYIRLNITFKDTQNASPTENKEACVKLGVYQNEEFKELYQYQFVLSENVNEYMLRVSADYYWYADGVNAISVLCDESVESVTLEVLECDMNVK